MLFVKTEVVSGCLLLKNFKRDLYLMGHKCMYGQIFQCMTWWYVAGMKYVLWCRYFIITFVRNEYQPIWSDFCRAIYIVACLRGFNFVCVCVCVRMCEHIPNVQCILMCWHFGSVCSVHLWLMGFRDIKRPLFVTSMTPSCQMTRVEST